MLAKSCMKFQYLRFLQYSRFQHLCFKCIFIYLNNINRGNLQFTTWKSKISDFRISNYLSGFVHGFHRRCTKFQGC